MERARIEAVEADLRKLPGVRSARLRVEGNNVQDVQIAADGSRSAQSLVRDVLALLFSRHAISLTEKRVSVVAPAGAAPRALEPEPVAPARETPGAARLRFRSVNVYREGGIAEAQVELDAGNRVLVGTARGAAIRRHLLRLVARATLGAIERLFSPDGLHGPVAWELLSVERRRLGDRVAVHCHLALLDGRRESHLVGTVFESGEPLEAIVLAVLDATNRVLPRLHEEDSVEYEIGGFGRGAEGTEA